MDEAQIKQLISDTITSSLASAAESIKTEVMSSVNSTLNGYEAKRKRISKAQPKPAEANEETLEDSESDSRIAELERKLAEKEEQEIKSKKSSAVEAYARRHQASEEFGEYFLLKYESDISINKDGSMRVGKQSLEEALDSFKDGKGNYFFPATVTTEDNEEGSTTEVKTTDSSGFDGDAFMSLLNM